MAVYQIDAVGFLVDETERRVGFRQPDGEEVFFATLNGTQDSFVLPDGTIMPLAANAINALTPQNFPTADELRDRSTHTGSINISVVTDLQATLDSKAVAATVTASIAAVNTRVDNLTIASIPGLQTELTRIASLIPPPGPGAPTNSVAPSIVGGAVSVGGTATADEGTWSGAATYLYQWIVGGANVDGETNSTYANVPASAGGQPLRVTVWGVSASGVIGQGVTSDIVTVGAAAALPSFNGTVPTISAGTSPRALYTATQASGTTGTVTTRTFEWFTQVGAETPVSRGTGTTYQAVDADGGKDLFVVETLTRTGAAGSVTAQSADRTLAAAPLAPVKTADPTVTQSGSILTAVNGSYTTNAGAVTIVNRWLRNGVVINDTGTGLPLSALTYQIDAVLDAGSTISFREAATNTEGTTTTVSPDTFTIAGSVPVLDSALSSRPTISVVSGGLRQGCTLQMNHGTYTGNPDSSLWLYQWFRDTLAGVISGATSQTYQTVSADANHNIFCRETPRNAAGSGSPVAALAVPILPAAATTSVLETSVLPTTGRTGDRGNEWDPHEPRSCTTSNGDEWEIIVYGTVNSGSGRTYQLWRRPFGSTTWASVFSGQTDFGVALLRNPLDDTLTIVALPGGLFRTYMNSAAAPTTFGPGQVVAGGNMPTQGAAYVGFGMGTDGRMAVRYQIDPNSSSSSTWTVNQNHVWATASSNGSAWSWSAAYSSPTENRYAYAFLFPGGHGDASKLLVVSSHDVGKIAFGRPNDGTPSSSFIFDGIRHEHLPINAATPYTTSDIIATTRSPGSDTNYTRTDHQDAIVDLQGRLHSITRKNDNGTTVIVYKVIGTDGAVLHTTANLQATYSGFSGNARFHLDDQGRLWVLQIQIASNPTVRVYSVNLTTFALTLDANLSSSFTGMGPMDGFTHMAAPRGGNRRTPVITLFWTVGGVPRFIRIRLKD